MIFFQQSKANFLCSYRMFPGKRRVSNHHLVVNVRHYENWGTTLASLKGRVAHDMFDNPDRFKRASYIGQVALIIFSIGFFSSWASTICVSSITLLGGCALNRFIDKCAE